MAIKVKGIGTIALDFVEFGVGELRPFPVVYMQFFAPCLELAFKTIVTDKQRKEGLTIESVKSMIDDVLIVKEWVQERDCALRAFELIGYIQITRKDYKNTRGVEYDRRM